jgi:uncharacterized ubiquitin-like protein YukD
MEERPYTEEQKEALKICIDLTDITLVKAAIKKELTTTSYSAAQKESILKKIEDNEGDLTNLKAAIIRTMNKEIVPFSEEQKLATQFYIKGFRERLEKDLGDQNQLVGLVQDAYKRSILTTAIPTPAQVNQVNNEAPTGDLSKAEVINTLINDITLPPSIHSQNINSIGGWVGSYMLGKLGNNFQELKNYTAENINTSLAQYSAAKELIDNKLGKYDDIEYRAAIEKNSLRLIARHICSGGLSIIDDKFKINKEKFPKDKKSQGQLEELKGAIASIKPQKISFREFAYSIFSKALDSVKRAFKREIPAKEVTSAAQPVQQGPVAEAPIAAQPVQQPPAAEAQTTTHKKAPPPVAPRRAVAEVQTTVQPPPAPKKEPPPVAPRRAVAEVQTPAPKKVGPEVAPRKRETQQNVKDLINHFKNQSAQPKSSIPGAIPRAKTGRSIG